jgi:hypothetical protein
MFIPIELLSARWRQLNNGMNFWVEIIQIYIAQILSEFNN